MSIDSHGMIDILHIASVIDCLKNEFAENNEIHTAHETVSIFENEISYYVSFRFKDKENGDIRQIYVLQNTDDFGYKFGQFGDIKHSTFGMGSYGNSEKIIARLVAIQGGGYVQPSDANDEWYYTPSVENKYIKNNYDKIEGDLQKAVIRKWDMYNLQRDFDTNIGMKIDLVDHKLEIVDEGQISISKFKIYKISNDGNSDELFFQVSIPSFNKSYINDDNYPVLIEIEDKIDSINILKGITSFFGGGYIMNDGKYEWNDEYYTSGHKLGM